MILRVSYALARTKLVGGSRSVPKGVVLPVSVHIFGHEVSFAWEVQENRHI